MTTDSIRAVSSSNISNILTAQKVNQDLQTLKADLKSNNLTAAQTDFAALLKDDPTLQSQSDSASTITQLSNSLNTGDVDSAQTAVTSLNQIVQSHQAQQGLGGSSSSGALNSAALLAQRKAQTVMPTLGVS